MDFSPPPPIPPVGRPGEPTRSPPPDTDPDATLLQHWDLLCGAVLERLATLAAEAAGESTEAQRWAAVADGVAQLQALRAVAERALARRPAPQHLPSRAGCRETQGC